MLNWAANAGVEGFQKGTPPWTGVFGQVFNDAGLLGESVDCFWLAIVLGWRADRSYRSLMCEVGGLPETACGAALFNDNLRGL